MIGSNFFSTVDAALLRRFRCHLAASVFRAEDVTDNGLSRSAFEKTTEDRAATTTAAHKPSEHSAKATLPRLIVGSGWETPRFDAILHVRQQRLSRALPSPPPTRSTAS